MNKDGIVWTGRHTIPAAVAFIFIEADKSFGPIYRQRPGGTGLDTFGLGFLPTHMHVEWAVEVILLNTQVGLLGIEYFLPGTRAYQLAILTPHTTVLIKIDISHGSRPPFWILGT